MSSPLTLSFDLGNATLMDAVWPLITNTEALDVNRGWYGHPGTLADQDKDNAGASWQIWSKPMSADGGSVAVLLISTSSATEGTLSLQLSNYIAGTALVRDIWHHKDLGAHAGTLRFPVTAMHDSVFLLLTCAN